MRIHLLLLVVLAACADTPDVTTGETRSARYAESAPGGVEAAVPSDASPAHESETVAMRLRNDTGMTITRIAIRACTKPDETPHPTRNLLGAAPLAAGAERSVYLPLGCHYARPTYDDGSPNGLEIGEKILVEGAGGHSFRLG